MSISLPWSGPRSPEAILEALLSGQSKRTVRYRSAFLKDLQAFVRAPSVLEALEALSIGNVRELVKLGDAFKHHLLRGSLPPNTVNRRLGALRAAFQVAHPDGAFLKSMTWNIHEGHRENLTARDGDGLNEALDAKVEHFRSGVWAEERMFTWAEPVQEKARKAAEEELERLMAQQQQARAYPGSQPGLDSGAPGGVPGAIRSNRLWIKGTGTFMLRKSGGMESGISIDRI